MPTEKPDFSHMVDTDKPTPGAQSLRRGLQMLRLLATHQADGLRLTDAIVATGLERSTVHRLLSTLADEHFAARDASTRRYRLGVEAMQLGLASLRRAPLVDGWRPLLQRLARLSGDTVFLLIREGDQCLCLHREEGDFPVKVFTIGVGQRRLLGVGAGGLALLAALPDAEIAALHARHRAAYDQAGFTLPQLQRAVRATRQAGYARITDTITPGVSGVGCTFRPSPNTLAAISFGAITPRLGAARARELGALLRDSTRAAPEGVA